MFSMIWAMTEERVIGKNNALPWNYKEDMKYFKETTINHKVVMGYNTYLSIKKFNEKVLPNRINYVLYGGEFGEVFDDNVIFINDLNNFIKENINSSEEIFIIGGASIYKLFLPYSKKLYVTMINKYYEGDTYFPIVDFEKYNLIRSNIVGELDFRVYEAK